MPFMLVARLRKNHNFGALCSLLGGSWSHLVALAEMGILSELMLAKTCRGAIAKWCMVSMVARSGDSAISVS